MDTLFYALLLLILILCAAFFAASEVAFTSLSKTAIRSIKKGKKTWEKKLTSLLDNQSKLITGLLIGNNFINILTTSLVTAFTINYFGVQFLPIATLIITFLLLFFGEIIPKTVATFNVFGFSKFFSIPVFYLLKLIKPISIFFSSINAFFIRVLKPKKTYFKPNFFDDEFKTLVSISTLEGELDTREHSLLNKALDFYDTKVREIMLPRTKIRAVEKNSTESVLLEEFKSSRFSRLPVYNQSLDTIIGFVHYKDFMFNHLTNFNVVPQKLPLNIVRKIAYVPENQSIQEFLNEMKNKKQNMAIVIDERGLTAGLVTVDDALAALFGTICDEFNTDTIPPLESIKIISTNHIQVPGSLKLTDFNELLKTKLQSDWYETIGGYLLEKMCILPKPQDVYEEHGFKFIIEEITNRAIAKISVVVLP